MSKYIVLNNDDIINLNVINSQNTDRKLNYTTLLDWRNVLSADPLSDPYWSDYIPLYSDKPQIDIDPMLFLENKLEWLTNRDGTVVLPENYLNLINYYTSQGELYTSNQQQIV